KCQGQQRHHGRTAQEFRLEPARRLENTGIDLAHLAEFRDAIAELPGTGSDPINEDRDNDEREQILTQIRVKRQIKKIKCQWPAKNGIVPLGGARRHITAAEVTNYG